MPVRTVFHLECTGQTLRKVSYDQFYNHFGYRGFGGLKFLPAECQLFSFSYVVILGFK